MNAFATAQPPQLVGIITDLLSVIEEQAKAIQNLLEENHQAMRRHCALAIKEQSTPAMGQLVSKIINLSKNTMESMAGRRKALDSAYESIRYLYATIQKNGSIEEVNVEPVLGDELKGILHRRALNQVLVERQKTPEQKTMLVMVTLDQLNGIQEEHGQDVVEIALKHFGHTMRSAIPYQDPIIRYTHETFLIVMHADINGARHSIEGIKDQLRRIPMIMAEKNKSLYLHFSGGIALLNTENPPEQSIKNATIALQAAQQSGGNCLKIMTFSNQDQKEH